MQHLIGLCRCGCGGKTKISEYTNTARKVTKGKPLPYLHGHWFHKTPFDYVIEDRGYLTPCWIWQRGTTTDGYSLCGTKRHGTRFVYKQKYVDKYGLVPEGLQLDHLCSVRRCVNPDHLEAVTGLVNTRRGKCTKLSYEDHDKILFLRAEGKTLREIAQVFDVSITAIWDVTSSNGRHGRKRKR